MACRILKRYKYMAVMVFAFIVLLSAFVREDAGLSQRAHADFSYGGKEQAGHGYAAQSMDSGSRLRANVPDGVLASESKSISAIRGGRAEENSAEYFAYLFGAFLMQAIFCFLLDGRAWSAVQSFSMEFQQYAMRQLQILQLCDGKKKILVLFPV